MIKGGQGRSPREIEGMGWILTTIFWTAVAATILILAAL